ncbi:MAG: hypothetical protein JRG87_04695, partial [Deltaproteobacteria bacterium]|nr:hypothetical protein [Deltaproteobacteria bacterium]
MNQKTDRSSSQKPTTAGGMFPNNSGSRRINVLGLCLGASTISLVHLDYEPVEDIGNPTAVIRPPRVVKYSRLPHEGDPKRALLSAVNGFDLKAFDRIV